MKDIEFLRTLEEFNLGIFGISDIARVIDKNRSYSRLFAKRLEDRGLIKRVERSKYALVGTDAAIVASNLVYPSYISFLSGLAYHRRTTQIPRELQIASSRSKKELSYGGMKITFIKLKKDRIFGYRRERLRGGFAFVGEIEKIILDSLLLPTYCPIDESYSALTGGVDKEKIVEYAMKMDSAVLLKRLGYLLELAGIDVYEKLKPRLVTKYEPLNPYLPREGEKNQKWRLIINEVL